MISMIVVYFLIQMLLLYQQCNPSGLLLVEKYFIHHSHPVRAYSQNLFYHYALLALAQIRPSTFTMVISFRLLQALKITPNIFYSIPLVFLFTKHA